MAGLAWAMLIAVWVKLRAFCPQFEGLETELEAKKEDHERGRRLLWRKGKTPQERDACAELASRVCQARSIPQTLASKRYVRLIRACLAANLLKLLRLAPDERVYLVTLIPAGHAFTIDELMQVDPRLLVQRLRVTLGRCGANPGVSGWAFGYLDGEYNLATGLFQLHWHLIVTGDLIKVFQRLKRRTAYKSVKRVADNPDGVATRVHIREVDDPQNPRPLTYVMKGSWYARWRGETGDNEDEVQRVVGPRVRIPEPYHSRVLLWLDQWEFNDMLIMINLKLGKGTLYRVQVPNTCY